MRVKNADQYEIICLLKCTPMLLIIFWAGQAGQQQRSRSGRDDIIAQRITAQNGSENYQQVLMNFFE